MSEPLDVDPESNEWRVTYRRESYFNDSTLMEYVPWAKTIRSIDGDWTEVTDEEHHELMQEIENHLMFDELVKWEISRGFAFRSLNAYDADDLKTRKKIFAKGSGGSPEEHVGQTSRTRFLSASMTMAGARKYKEGAAGVIVIDLAKVRVAYNQSELLAALSVPHNIGNAQKGAEILIDREIPLSAIVWQGKAFIKDPDEPKKSKAERAKGVVSQHKTDPAHNRYVKLKKTMNKGRKLTKAEEKEFAELSRKYQ